MVEGNIMTPELGAAIIALIGAITGLIKSFSLQKKYDNYRTEYSTMCFRVDQLEKSRDKTDAAFTDIRSELKQLNVNFVELKTELKTTIKLELQKKDDN